MIEKICRQCLKSLGAALAILAFIEIKARAVGSFEVRFGPTPWCRPSSRTGNGIDEVFADLIL